ncbi:hypothetical protein H5407_04090 [Mitsuaria sp. WAJ17]|uniref:hypothetical protein n=1 Tax=Mitsuaria sp. WAJ17 TaxID=2761452 RepID=UPI0016026629|nr:hypothetical protein [Mitsuaria sp. WAJ17]MBB2484401.1 hypothetical protein [Mitsuaria sp. WAJ17]
MSTRPALSHPMDHVTLPAAPRRWPLTLLVIALHLLLLAGLQAGLLHRPAPQPAETRRVTVTLLQDRPQRTAPGAQAAAKRRATAPPQPRSEAAPTAALAPETPQPRSAEVPQSLAQPTAPAASAPQERLIDSPATRAALRQAAREPLNGEKHLMAQEQETGVSASEKLGRKMQQAGYGDCSKGQFAGAGLGLLSAPFYLLAEASGKCAKGSPPPAAPPPEPSGRNGAHASMRER